MKHKYFYKIDHNRQPIPGSNISRKSKPGNNHQWREILDPCCLPLEVDCTCGPRFFVQLDGLGKPLGGTLIKRNGIPQMSEGIKYYEIDWKPVCCPKTTPITVVNSCGSTWMNYRIQFFNSDGSALLAETALTLNANPQVVEVPIIEGGYIIKFKWLTNVFPDIDESFEVWEGPAITGVQIINELITESTIPPQSYSSTLREKLVLVYTLTCEVV